MRERGENKGKRGQMRKVPRCHFLSSEIRKEQRGLLGDTAIIRA
jgi:hypothetical protein